VLVLTRTAGKTDLKDVHVVASKVHLPMKGSPFRILQELQLPD
jgi:hypothetical protein